MVAAVVVVIIIWCCEWCGVVVVVFVPLFLNFLGCSFCMFLPVICKLPGLVLDCSS